MFEEEEAAWAVMARYLLVGRDGSVFPHQLISDFVYSDPRSAAYWAFPKLLPDLTIAGARRIGDLKCVITATADDPAPPAGRHQAQYWLEHQAWFCYSAFEYVFTDHTFHKFISHSVWPQARTREYVWTLMIYQTTQNTSVEQFIAGSLQYYHDIRHY